MELKMTRTWFSLKSYYFKIVKMEEAVKTLLILYFLGGLTQVTLVVIGLTKYNFFRLLDKLYENRQVNHLPITFHSPEVEQEFQGLCEKETKGDDVIGVTISTRYRYFKVHICTPFSGTYIVFVRYKIDWLCRLCC